VKTRLLEGAARANNAEDPVVILQVGAVPLQAHAGAMGARLQFRPNANIVEFT